MQATRVIVPPSKLSLPSLGEIWQYRELLYFLVWRDLKVRYKQSVLGVLWAVLQPLATMLVFTIIFNHFLRVTPDSGAPYALFVYTALVPWLYLSSVLTRCTESVVSNANLLSKVYFPRMFIPISAVLSGLVDFGASFVILIALLIWFGITPTAGLIAVPLVILLVVTLVLGLGLWLSALNVQYRDVRYMAPLLIQIWMYATPIIYPLSYVPADWQWLLALNPMTDVVGIFRGALLGAPMDLGMVAFSAVTAVALLASGVLYFAHVDDILADVV